MGYIYLFLSSNCNLVFKCLRDNMDSIDGVAIKNLVKYVDKRGYFMEILRGDDNLLSKFGQTAVSLTMSGVIKAFHWHKKQDDLFFVASGDAMVVLYDRRSGSSTYGKIQVVFAGESDPKLIFIPKGVAHGYKVLGDKPVLMFYHMTESYDAVNPDEGRIDFDDKTIGFDWESGRCL